MTSAEAARSSRHQHLRISTRGALWRVPEGRMKMRQEHLVPLSNQAIALLRELQKLTGG
jgi:integrase